MDSCSGLESELSLLTLPKEVEESVRSDKGANTSVDASISKNVSSISDNKRLGCGGKLVLVESCPTSLHDVKERDVVAEDASRKEISNASIFRELQRMAQQIVELMEANKKLNLLTGFEDTIRAVNAKMDRLQEQMREMQVHLLKNSLSTHSPGFPGSLFAMKQESLFRPHDQVFLTPRKAQEQPLRLDVTPASKHSPGTEQQTGVSSTAMVNSRRSLAFPKSLEAILDENKENRVRSGNNGILPRDPLSERPTPKLSLVEIKSEQESDESPHRESKLGLLVLADAALTRSPEHSGLFLRATESFQSSDYDSGRSTAGNSSRSSPSTSQEELKVKVAEKFARYGAYSNGGLQVPKTANSSSSSCASDTKSRKRRKAKQPLPCNFCGKCFNNQSSLRQHESFHRPTRPFKCENENCDKAYKTRSELNRHLVVHSGEKKHECKLCGKRFLRKQYLKTHLLRHHETGIAMVAPSAIDSFKDDSSGTIPSIVVSSSLVSKTEPLTWRCNMCFKIFVNSEDLARHVRSYHEKKKANIMEDKMETCSNFFEDSKSLIQQS